MRRLLPFPHLHRHMVRRKLHLLCAQRGVLPRADEQRCTGRALQHGPVSRVVRIEHTRPAKPEQAGLGGPVGLHGLMEIEVVLRQVRERTDRERDTVHAVQRQRMGRDLHHHMRAARIEHLPQQALQGKALGRRALRGEDGVANAVFDRADEADLRAERLLEHMLDKAGHGRLAVRPRHADHAQALRRMAEPVAAELRQRRARIAHAHPRRVLRHVVLAQHTGRAARKGGGNEAVAVRDIARNGGKQLAGRGRAGIIAHARQLQLRVGVLFEHLDALQKLV